MLAIIYLGIYESSNNRTYLIIIATNRFQISISSISLFGVNKGRLRIIVLFLGTRIFLGHYFVSRQIHLIIFNHTEDWY